MTASNVLMGNIVCVAVRDVLFVWGGNALREVEVWRTHQTVCGWGDRLVEHTTEPWCVFPGGMIAQSERNADELCVCVYMCLCFRARFHVNLRVQTDVEICPGDDCVCAHVLLL